MTTEKTITAELAAAKAVAKARAAGEAASAEEDYLAAFAADPQHPLPARKAAYAAAEAAARVVAAAAKLTDAVAECERVRCVCKRIAATQQQRHASRLWDWVDAQACPEPLWDIMMRELPWAFADNSSPNSIRFPR